MHGGGHWKAQLRAQWEATRRRANAGAQTDALYADAGAQTTRPVYSDGGAQTLLGADDEDARPAPSYASDDEADARLAARIVAPAPAKLALVAAAHQEQLPTLTEIVAPTLDVPDGKSASARRQPPRSGALTQTPAAASSAPDSSTRKGDAHGNSSSSHSLHTARSPPPPYAPPASPMAAVAPPSASQSASASSPSRSRKAVSPPVPKSSPSAPASAPAVAVAVAADVPPPPQRERLFIRIPARKRPVPAPAFEPQTPVEQQLASPTLVQSPPAPAPPEAAVVSGRKRPRARPLEEASPAKRALPASNGHSDHVSEPVAGPSRLGEQVALESVPVVRPKRQTKSTKSRVAPLPPAATTTAAVSSYAAVTAPARARQWPSLSMTAVSASTPEADTEPPGPTLSIAEALATPPVEQARPVVPRKRTRSPSATTADLPRRAHTPTGAHAAAASPVAATVRRLAHTEAEHEQIPERKRDAVADGAHVPSAPDAQGGASPDRPASLGFVDDAPAPASLAGPRAQVVGSTHSLDATAHSPSNPEQRAKRVPRMRGPAPARDAQNGPAAAGPSAARTAPAPAPLRRAPDTPDREHASPTRASTSAGPSAAPHSARPKITLRLKLPRAPSPPPRSPARDRTESPVGMCFPSPPAPSAPALPAAPSRAVPAELLAAFGGPGEEEEEDAPRSPEPVEAASKAAQAQPLSRPASALHEPLVVEEPLGVSSRADGLPDARQDDAPRERSPDSAPTRAVSPLPLLLDPAVLADAHARPAEEDALRESARSPLLQHASAVIFQGGADVDTGMPDDGAPVCSGSPPSDGAVLRKRGRAPSARADSPNPMSSRSSQNDAEEEDADMNMAEDGAPSPPAPSIPDPAEPAFSLSPQDAEDVDMGVEEDASSPPPAVPSAAVSRKSARTPSLEQRALSAPRRSSTPASPSPAPASPLVLHTSPRPLRSSPPPDHTEPSPKSGPMSPPWSPVALPDEMMQLLMLGGEPLPMPVFDPLPAPPDADAEDEFNSGVEDEVERMLEVAPPEKPAKKRRRRASAKRKSRAVVGDSD